MMTMVIKQCTGNSNRTLICLRRDEDDKQKEEQKEEFRGRDVKWSNVGGEGL